MNRTVVLDVDRVDARERLTVYIVRQVPVRGQQAAAALREGTAVCAPHAGKDDYPGFFANVGYPEAVTLNAGVPQGDRVFGVRDGLTGLWYLAQQASRAPGAGFAYSVEAGAGFHSLEALRDFAARW